MPSYPALLIASSGALAASLGVVHLYYTFGTDNFSPRDPELRRRLEAESPVLTRQLTMWKAWIGFHASHAVGLLLFGAVYADLALLHLPVLLGAPFLLLTGAGWLLALLVLCKVYWFNAPFRGVALALLLYVTGVIAGLASS
jgi:hypothetical protein